MKDKQFLRALFRVIHRNIFNNHRDNWDLYRFGEEPAMDWRIRIRNLKSNLFKYGKHFINSTGVLYIPSGSSNEDSLQYFQFLYKLLETDEDKNLLINILAYRILGYRKIRLPLNTPKYWQDLKIIEEHEERDKVIQIGFMNFKLAYSDLSYLNYPIKLFFSPAGIIADYVIEQYHYSKSGITITAQPGDVIIDGGACFGDTALYFANRVGARGMVHSFEFIPDNISIWQRNVTLNENISSCIKIARHPLWSSSDIEVFYKSNGPASSVSFRKFDQYDGVVKTITIDDYARNNNLQSVDFIKLDIEGAELEALKGAIEVLRSFKPKLAIALYHKPEDFEEIPRFIKELNLGYHFYISHVTIHQEESILFANCPK